YKNVIRNWRKPINRRNWVCYSVKNIRTFNGKIVCPRCDGNGLIYKTNIEELIGIKLFVCDECEATWEKYEEIGMEILIDLTTYLETKGLNYSKVNFINENYDWISDPEEKVSKEYYDCPLLNIMIWIGDCYDINAVRNEMVKKSVLHGLETELSKTISFEKANEICKRCKHSF
ncbi:hypothetical protein ABES02_29040, partial [Neobacillus pocheonensis]|uniref:hypothetical protein n=1 Tax=Neobacillus pocheonensis TaxID=363869 RepID=UPI003D2BEE93